MSEQVESCLNVNQAGTPEVGGISEQEVRAYLAEQAQTMGLELADVGAADADPQLPPGIVVPEDFVEAVATANLRAPRFHRIYQARAATRRNRTHRDINKLVLHTPEGSEAGTISVLRNGRAGFDLFRPNGQRLYKCNDWFRHVCWQAGHWPTNLTSVGYEIDSYASTSGNWSDAFYRIVAYDCAWMMEGLTIPLAHASHRSQAGLIYHATVTPGARTDPGRNFRIGTLMEAIRDHQRGAGPTPDPPPKEKETDYERVNFLAHGARDVAAARAARRALNSIARDRGMQGHFARLVTDKYEVAYVSRISSEAKKSQVISVVVGKPVEQHLSPAVKIIGTLNKTDVVDAMGASYQDTLEKVSWRLAAICDELGFGQVEKSKVLAIYKREVGI